MQIFNLIKNNYILSIIYCLGGLSFTYKLIRNQIKQIQQLLRNKKVYYKPTPYNEIIQTKENESESLIFLKQQIIFGKVKQLRSDFLPQTNILEEKYLSVKKKNTCTNEPSFFLTDSKNQLLEINLHSNIHFKDNLYQPVEQRDEKIQNKLKILGYNKLFIASFSEQRIKFGTPMVIIGDLIFNKNTQSIRCYKQYFMGDLKTFKSYLQSSTIRQSCYLIVSLLSFAYFCIYFYKIHKRNRQQCTKLTKITISKGNDSLLCQECKKQLIDTFFSPCGHFNHCYDCAKPFQNCPNCDEYIEETIKTFKN
ncbi:unnamed protein product [Paramecium sonneborni]|uniref:RING-type domain-containing protein n=1 Tax=Paramecium sonneborni TaxID=65129 RepID=A0A8S1PN06_9CILI|nr:unnamed protein product [Paramecium sonneborni]